MNLRRATGIAVFATLAFLTIAACDASITSDDTPASPSEITPARPVLPGPGSPPEATRQAERLRPTAPPGASNPGFVTASGDSYEQWSTSLTYLEEMRFSDVPYLIMELRDFGGVQTYACNYYRDQTIRARVSIYFGDRLRFRQFVDERGQVQYQVNALVKIDDQLHQYQWTTGSGNLYTMSLHHRDATEFVRAIEATDSKALSIFLIDEPHLDRILYVTNLIDALKHTRVDCFHR